MSDNKKIAVSVFIIAKNEEDRIEKPILSVRDWVEEVIVIDSGSDDKTVEVSEKLGARVIFNKWHGYGAQKIFGENQCKNNWLLNLDADEEVSAELGENIRSLFANGEPENSAYKFKWKILFRFENKPPPFAPGGEFIRLYDKTKAGFRDSIVHDSVVVKEGDVGNIEGMVLHRCFKSLHHWVEKINFYSGMQAQDFYNKRRVPSSVRIVFEPFAAFVKAYVIRRYFLYGIDGFVGSFLYAYARLIRLAKAREMFAEERYKRENNEK